MAAKVVYNNSNYHPSEFEKDLESAEEAMALTMEDTINVDKFKVR